MLKPVRFVAEKVEERARWYKALSQVCTGNLNLPAINRQPSIAQDLNQAVNFSSMPKSGADPFRSGDSPREGHKAPG